MISFQASTLWAGALLCVISPTAEVLEFAPKPNTTIVRTLAVQMSTEVEKATVTFMDHEIETGAGVSMSLTRKAQIVDVLGKVEDGRVLDFVRTYEEVVDDSTTEGEDDQVKISAADGEPSDLEGQKVAFAWDAEEEVYVPKYAGEEPGEEEWLEGLEASLDLTNWLPDGELEVGGQWELSMDELSSLIWFGGRLYPIQSDEVGEDREGAISISVPNLSETHVLSGSDGTIQLTLERVDEEDGDRIAVVTFKWKGTVEQDLAEEVSALSEAKGEGQTYDAAEQIIEMTGSGEFSWDLKAGRLLTLSLDMDQDIEENAEWSSSAHGMDLELSFASTKKQTYHIELGFELAPEEK